MTMEQQNTRNVYNPDKISFTISIEWHNTQYYKSLIESLRDYLKKIASESPVNGYIIHIDAFHLSSELVPNSGIIGGITISILTEPNYHMDTFYVRALYNNLKNRVIGFVDGFMAFKDHITPFNTIMSRSIIFSFGENSHGFSDEIYKLD